MNIDVQPLAADPNVTCVSISGRIDAYTTERVEEELSSLIRIGSDNLLCDLAGVEFVSSSGFKAFQRMVDQARQHGGDLKICGLTGDVRQLFDSVGFASVTSCYGTKDEALSGMGLAAPSSGSDLDRTVISVPSSSLDKTVISTPSPSQGQQEVSSGEAPTIIQGGGASRSQPKVPDSAPRPALIETVRLSLYPDKTQFQNLSQLLGTVGALAGVSSMRTVKLNVAVVEICRSLIRDLGPVALQMESDKWGLNLME